MDYSTYLILSLVGFGFSVAASLFTSFIFNKFKAMPASRDVTPSQFAKEVIEQEGLNIGVELIGGELSDHYDPRAKVIRISAQNAALAGVSQLAVTAHELGHALQGKGNGILFSTRNILAGVVGISTNIGYLMVVIGLAISWLDLATLGLIFFSAATVFMVLTVPIEIDASVKGLGLLKKYSVISGEESGAAKLLLTAAAGTYLAAFMQTLLQLVYFVSMVSGRKRRS